MGQGTLVSVAIKHAPIIYFIGPVIWDMASSSRSQFSHECCSFIKKQLWIIALSDDLIKGPVHCACAEWNSFSREATKWSTFFNQEFCFLSKLILVGLEGEDQNDFTNYDNNG